MLWSLLSLSRLPVACQPSSSSFMADRSSSRKRGRDYESSNGSSAGQDIAHEIQKQRIPGPGEDSASVVGSGPERRSEVKSTCLRKGMVVLKGFLSPQEQAELAVRLEVQKLCRTDCIRTRPAVSRFPIMGTIHPR